MYLNISSASEFLDLRTFVWGMRKSSFDYIDFILSALRFPPNYLQNKMSMLSRKGMRKTRNPLLSVSELVPVTLTLSRHSRVE